MEARVEGLIKQLQEVTDKSVCVGFGVAQPEQVRGGAGRCLPAGAARA
jgi:tryptophan synthase alpha chain